jgi:hypothetical protein
MSPMYPLTIVNTASVTSLVRMTLYHHAIGVYHARVETDEDMAVLGRKARNAAAENPAARLVSHLPSVRSVKNQMATEEAKS